MKIPLSLYVHFPWCVKKCPYCDFNSHELAGDLPEAEYVSALLADLDQDMQDFQLAKDVSLGSIFIGGGTPSLFSPGAIHDLLDGIAKRCQIHANTEITMEANPGTIDATNFSGYHRAGVNRISLGVQSFGNDQLIQLGRIHNADQASRAFEVARNAGFQNINIDLMHGLPRQDVSLALTDLEKALALEPEHLSWYQLTIEPNTAYYRRPPQLPDDDVLWQIYEQGSEALNAAGFQRYEVSAFSRPGKASVHNQNYWQFGDYLGIGAGAHGKLTQQAASQFKVSRTNKTRLPKDYLNGQKRNTQEVAVTELPLEFLMNTLRLVAGFELPMFTERTGLPADTLQNFIAVATSKKLLETNGETIKPTALGLQYLNNLLLLAADHTSGL
jgi:oxygen-independent coproporphyrinogen-3 oxidase